MDQRRAASWRGNFLNVVGAFSLSLVAAVPITHGRAIAFEEAVQAAVGASPLVAQAEHKLGAQRERVRSTWSDLGPRVTATAMAVNFDEESRASFGGNSFVLREKEARTGELLVTQPITGLYALVERTRFEGIQREVAEANQDLARQGAAFSAAALYVRAYQSERLFNVSRARVEAVESQKKDAESMLAVGRIHRGDFLKFEIALTEAKSNAARAKATADATGFAFREAVGLGQETDVHPSELPELATETPVPTFEAAIEQALAARGDLVLAEKGHESARFARKLVYAKFAPNVSAFYKLEHNFGDLGFGGDKDTRSVGVALSWDLWNNGAQVFEAREAGRLVAAADAGVTGTRQKVRIEVMESIANLAAAREAFAVGEAGSAQAAEAYRIEQAKFAAGKSSATELILSENSKALADSNRVAAKAEYVLRSFDVQRVLGSPWPSLAGLVAKGTGSGG